MSDPLGLTPQQRADSNWNALVERMLTGDAYATGIVASWHPRVIDGEWY